MKTVILILLTTCLIHAKNIVVTNNAELDAAMKTAVSGDVVLLRAGTYRMTIVPTNSGVRFQNYENELAIISGLEPITTAWTVHSGNIYKTMVTLPVTDYQSTLNSNNSILANQIFKNGVMQIEARWPNINSYEDYLNIATLRPIGQMVTFQNDYLTDNGLPNANLTNGHVFILGWFIATTRKINSQNNKTLYYSSLQDQNPQFRKYYYVTHHLALLDAPKEWHYQNGTLYFYQENGGLPTGVEYKKRNWGFDLRGKSNTTIVGLQFIGCDPVMSDGANTVVDNIRATFMNHNFQHERPNSDLSFSARQTGIKLLGATSVIKNSELRVGAGNAVWLGQGGRAENNLITGFAYDGNWGAAVAPWGSTGGQVITRNSMYRLGRSGINLMNNGGSHTNMDIGYNDIHDFSMLNNDTGGIYSGVMTDHTGTRFHHNWVYNNLTPDPLNASGIQVGIYFDQASGPVTIDHNVCWKNGVADYYAEIKNEWRNTGGHKLYNNTFASVEPVRHSYVTYITTPNDIQRNNIYRNDIVVNWGASPGNIQNSLLENVDPLFVGPANTGSGYKITSNSPAINKGVVIGGITDGSNGAPDIGAYEVGQDWAPGYKSTNVEPIPPDTIPDPEPEPEPLPPVVLKDTVFHVTLLKGYVTKGMEIHRIDSVDTPIASGKFEAESGQLAGATVAGYKVCCIQANGTLRYTNKVSTGKMRIRFARANAGNGVLKFKIGNSAEITLSFPTTGTTWDTMLIKEFIIPAGSGDVILTAPAVGPADLDYIELY